MKFILIILMLVGCLSSWGESKNLSPIILGEAEAKPFIEICKATPAVLKDNFEYHSLFKTEDVFLQCIAMPSGKTYLIISGLSLAGLIIFNEENEVEKVLNWGAYLRSHFYVYAMDKAYHRFHQENNIWVLTVEYHAMTDRRDGDHYLWQFDYKENGTSARHGRSKRYKLK